MTMFSLDDGMSSDISESMDGATGPAGKVSSSRKSSRLSILWELGQYCAWRPALTLLVFGYRPGFWSAKPAPVQEEAISSSDDSQLAWYIENTVPPTNLGNWLGSPGRNSTAPGQGSMLEPVGDPTIVSTDHCQGPQMHSTAPRNSVEIQIGQELEI